MIDASSISGNSAKKIGGDGRFIAVIKRNNFTF